MNSKLSDLIKPEPVIVSKRSQVEKWQEDITPVRRAELGVIFSNVPKVFGSLVLQEPRILTKGDGDTLMTEWEALEAAETAIAARKKTIREIVFTGMDEALRAQGEDFDVEITKGFIDSPLTGKSFAREGGGRSEPKIDLAKFKELASQGLQDQVIKRTVIPEQVVEEIDDAALLAIIKQNPELIELVRQTIVVGSPRPVKLAVRKTKDDAEL